MIYFDLLQPFLRSGSVDDLIDAFGGKVASRGGEGSVDAGGETRRGGTSDNAKQHSKDMSSNDGKDGAASPPEMTMNSTSPDVDEDDSEATTEGADSPGSSAPASPLRCLVGAYSLANPPLLYAR